MQDSFSPSRIAFTHQKVYYTQVGSPAVRLRLARCTAWVKRWSEAMDFLQTIFKTNIFLLRILENRNSRKLSQSIYGGSRQK